MLPDLGRIVSGGASIRGAALLLAGLYASTAHAATIPVAAGGDLQAALDAAQPGDEIVLQAGARYIGLFTLPPKPTGPVITIRSSAVLPMRRVTPADAPLMPTIASGSGMSAIACDGGANWTLDGLRFEPNTNGQGNLIQIQDCSNITIDRMLFVAPEAIGQRRAVMGNGRYITLTRSHIAGVWAQTLQDSQAFCAWDGAGPYTITDNYLEAASENVMFGGANSAAPDRIPSDILVEGNHLSKRLEWKGVRRAVKNLFELKSAKRVVIRNNLMERNWTDAQAGYAVLFTARNDEGGAPWSVVEDVLFENNVVRDTENGFNILGYDSYQASGRTSRVTIRNNLVVTTGIFLKAGGEVGPLTFDHNTIEQGDTFTIAYKGDVWVAGAAAPRPAAYAIETLTMTNNLARHNTYGFWGEESAIGSGALGLHTRSYTWTHNVIAGEQGWPYTYPVVTWQPSMTEYRAQFNADYTLNASSIYRAAATDGTDLGRLTTVQGSGSTPVPPPSTLPPPEPVPPIDTTGPTVTLKQVGKNPNTLKFRVDARDPSGVAQVQVVFGGVAILTTAKVPADFDIAYKSLTRGTYSLTVTAIDGIGNATTTTTAVVK